MSNPVPVTSQPTPSAPLEELTNHVPVNTEKVFEPSALNVVVTQPAMENMKLGFAQTEAEMDEEELERRRRRNQDFCCFACADSCADDSWCWYIMCRMYCRCLGICCESFANCMDSCGEGCANCLHECCEGSNDGCCGDGDDGCCSGGSGVDGGDDCDCDGCCFD